MSEDPMDDHATPREVERLRAALADVRAPDRLRTRIEAERARTAPRRAIRRRFQLLAPVVAAAALAGVVLALVAPSGAPSVLDAAALAASRPVAAAPAPLPAHPEELAAAVGGVHFPAWGAALRWVPTGSRADTLEGRATRTVFYTSPKRRTLGYTIVDGKALDWPDGDRVVTRNGVEIHVVRDGDRRVVAWRVGGRTCVMSAPAAVPEERLVMLASVSTYG